MERATMIRKAFTSSTEVVGDRTVRGWFSTPSVDLMGEIVEADAWDLSVFIKNPVALFAHNPEKPIGTVSNLEVVPGQGLRGDFDFYPEGVSKHADELCQLAKLGLLKTFSVGFDATACVPIDPARPRGPQRYTKAKLMEISFVTTPANTDCAVTERALDIEAKMTEKTHNPLKFKGLYDVGRLACLMSELGWQHDQSVWEEACEGDTASVVPGKLADVLHLLGETLIAMTTEEVGECLNATEARMGCLDDALDTVEVIEMGAAPAVRKFRAGVLMAKVEKSGKKISAAVAQQLQDVADSHDALHGAMKAHTKCMKAFQSATPGNLSTASAEADASHTQMTDAMKAHTKCVKSLSENIPQPDQASPDGKDDEGTSEKALPVAAKPTPTPVSKQKMMLKVRALAAEAGVALATV